MDIFNDPEFQQEMIKRIREKLMASMDGGGASPGKDATSIVNNLYGNSGGGMNGLVEQMNGGPQGPAPDDFDYLVDIERRDLPEVNEATGRPVGWKKTVNRRRIPKGE